MVSISAVESLDDVELELVFFDCLQSVIEK